MKSEQVLRVVLLTEAGLPAPTGSNGFLLFPRIFKLGDWRTWIARQIQELRTLWKQQARESIYIQDPIEKAKEENFRKFYYITNRL